MVDSTSRDVVDPDAFRAEVRSFARTFKRQPAFLTLRRARRFWSWKAGTPFAATGCGPGPK